MNIRRQEGQMGTLTNLSKKIKNTSTDRRESTGQAKAIKNTSGGKPRAVGPTAPCNAVNRPNQS